MGNRVDNGEETEPGDDFTDPVVSVPSPPVVATKRHSGMFVKNDPRRGVGIKGVAGRPANIVRAAARLAYAQRIEMLCRIADGEPMPFTRRFLAREGKKLPDGTICTKEQEEAGTIIEAKWEESADLDQRMKAVHMLGAVGLLRTPDDEAKNQAPKAVYQVTFD